MLQRLIALTSERDSNSLEIAIAQTLFDLVSPGAVVIYRIRHDDDSNFHVTTIGEANLSNHTSQALDEAIKRSVDTGKSIGFMDENGGRIILYPLRGAKQQILAVLALATQENDEDQNEVASMLLNIYQNFVNLMNDNERDTLTGLLNRKTFELRVSKLIEQRWHRKRKDDQDSSQHYLAIFDIDHFKHVNDNFGHLIGDEVLLTFSQIMSKTFRDKDMLFRFGGEEFVCVFECESVSEIEMILNRFREKIGHHPFPQVGHVTVSAGYTEVREHDVFANMIDRADMALYHAKKNGRNQVCQYEHLVAIGALEESLNSGEVELF